MSEPVPAPDDASLASAVSEALAHFMASAAPHHLHLTRKEAAEQLSTFVGVPVPRVLAALVSSTAADAVSPAELDACVARLMRDEDGTADAWWACPGVTLQCVDGAAAATQSAEAVRGGPSVTATRSSASAVARSHQPPARTSADQSSGQPSMRPTEVRGWWGPMCGPRAGAFSTASTDSSLSRDTAASMERLVAAALGELDFFLEDEPCPVAGVQEAAVSRRVSEARLTERAPRDASQPAAARSRSPSPVVPVALRASRRSPMPGSTATLAALDGLVRRGKTAKVCKQFVRTGHCSFGARCLYHHPVAAAAAPLQEGRDTGEAAVGAPQRTRAPAHPHASLPCSHGGAPLQPAWTYTLPVPTAAPLLNFGVAPAVAAAPPTSEARRSMPGALPMRAAGLPYTAGTNALAPAALAERGLALQSPRPYPSCVWQPLV